MLQPAVPNYNQNFFKADFLSHHARALGIKRPAGDQVLHALCVITRAEAVLNIQFIGLHDLVAVDLDTKTALLGKVNAAVNDLHRLLGQALTAFLPDPVCVDTIELAGYCCCALYNHGKADVKVVIGVASPHQAEVIAELADANGTVHGPEMRICQRNIHCLQCEDACPQHIEITSWLEKAAAALE